MNPLYNAGIALYRFGARLASMRIEKIAIMVKGQKAAFDYLSRTLNREHRYIWIHAASLGEFEQGRPLIEKIRSQYPDRKILLTFFSPSGYEVRKNYDKVDAVCYLPFDTVANARRFIDLVNPEMAIFVKYEFWGNYMQQLAKRNIPTYLISAIFRKSQSFFKPLGGTFRNILKCYTHIYVQDDNSRQLLAGININNVTVAGDTRFDRVTDIMKTTVELPQIAAFKASASHIMVVGSSWEADEAVYSQWLNDSPRFKAIIAPHEFDAHRLAQLQKAIPGSMLWSQIKERTEFDFSSVRCIIIDCFGLLASIYRYGDIAYIGGGFGAGIHNINEAAVYGMPIIFGSRFDKFKEACDLTSLGGAFSINSKEEFEQLMQSMSDEKTTLSGNIARQYIEQNIGATDKIFADIFRRR